MIPVRRVPTVLVLLSALGAGFAGVCLPISGGGKLPIRHYFESPWINAVLLAYLFGTVLVPVALADPRKQVVQTLKIWAILVLICSSIWLVPLALAPGYGWPWDWCYQSSLRGVFWLMILSGFYRLFRPSASHPEGVKSLFRR